MVHVRTAVGRDHGVVVEQELSLQLRIHHEVGRAGAVGPDSVDQDILEGFAPFPGDLGLNVKLRLGPGRSRPDGVDLVDLHVRQVVRWLRLLAGDQPAAGQKHAPCRSGSQKPSAAHGTTHG